MNKHLEAIRAGTVTRSNIIGIRKAINAAERGYQGFSVSRTAPKVSVNDVAEIEEAMETHEPLATGELHEGGVKTLRNKRHAKRLAAVLPIINSPSLRFRLIGFERIGNRGLYSTPIYRAEAEGLGSFAFINIPWQSGGNGPELI